MVQIRKKVTLRTKRDPEAGTSSTSPVSKINSENRKGNDRKKRWPWFLVAALILSGVLFALFRGNNSSSSSRQASLEQTNELHNQMSEDSVASSTENVNASASTADVTTATTPKGGSVETSSVPRNNQSTSVAESSQSGNKNVVPGTSSDDRKVGSSSEQRSSYGSPNSTVYSKSGVDGTAKFTNSGSRYSVTANKILKVTENHLVCFFNYDDYQILGTTDFSKLLEKVKYTSVVIKGYADTTGDTYYNQSLSQNRADAVREYLIGNGVKESAVTATGYGESSQHSTKAENRRADIYFY